MHDALLSLVRMYEQHGAVFRVGGPERGPVVLAGPKANVLLAQSGDRYFRSWTFYAHSIKELGADHFVVAMDCAPHQRMRAFMHRFQPGRHLPLSCPDGGYHTRDCRGLATVTEGRHHTDPPSAHHRSGGSGHD